MTYAAPRMHVAIAELHQNSANLSIIGLVVGKTEVKSFPDRKNIGSERYTFSFTIKDSPEHLINISSWGTEEYINGLSSCFRIGDCVIVEKPLTVTKDPEKDDKFCPSTLSLYRLLLTENHSAIKVLSDTEADSRLLSLFHLPVKDHRDFYSLGDIVANGQSLDGNVINILAVVQSIGEPKYFTTGDGRKGQRCEVKLFDEVIMSFCLICWDRENLQYIQTWIPRETVLFVADARVTFDNFRKSMIATIISKTIITVNPDTKEAVQLFKYARDFAGTGALDDQEKLSGDQVSLDSISDVFTVEQLKVSIQKNLDKQDIIYGIVYAFITTLNLDASVSKVIRNRWCWYQVSEDMQNCSNPVCPREAQLEVTTSFDLLVDITDHTGTLQSCTLSGTVAEQTLGYSAEEFVHLKEQEKIALKWKFLLERCKILLKILPSPKTRNGFRGNILSCTLADPGEVKQSFTREAL